MLWYMLVNFLIFLKNLEVGFSDACYSVITLIPWKWNGLFKMHTGIYRHMKKPDYVNNFFEILKNEELRLKYKSRQ